MLDAPAPAAEQEPTAPAPRNRFDQVSGVDVFFAHAIVRKDDKAKNAAAPEVPVVADPKRRDSQPPGARSLGVRAVEVVAARPFAKTWRASFIDGPHRGEDVALVVLSAGSSAPVRERFACAAEGLLSAGEAGANGVLRVRALAPSRDAYLADLWTAGSTKDLSALRWTLRHRVEFVAGVARALETLHSLGLAHGCLCPENVLLDDDLNPVLSEVGMPLSQALLDDPQALFSAPEVRAGGAPSPGSDVFSAGMLLRELVGGDGDEIPALVEVTRQCLAPADSRLASAAGLAKALAAIAETLPESQDAYGSGAEAPHSRGTAARPRQAPLPVALPSSTHPSSLSSALDRLATPVGRVGLLAVGFSVGGAFYLGGSTPSLRDVFAVGLAVGFPLATCLLPRGRRLPFALRLTLAGAIGALLLALDPLDLVYRAAAQRDLRGGESARRAAIEEIVRLGRDFRGLRLAGVDLSGLDLTGADLRGVDLSKADLSRSRLWGAEVEGASLRGARLEGADLDRTSLALAHIDAATCDQATRLPAGWRCVGSQIVR